MSRIAELLRSRRMPQVAVLTLMSVGFAGCSADMQTRLSDAPFPIPLPRSLKRPVRSGPPPSSAASCRNIRGRRRPNLRNTSRKTCRRLQLLRLTPLRPAQAACRRALRFRQPAAAGHTPEAPAGRNRGINRRQNEAPTHHFTKFGDSLARRLQIEPTPIRRQAPIRLSSPDADSAKSFDGAIEV